MTHVVGFLLVAHTSEGGVPLLVLPSTALKTEEEGGRAGWSVVSLCGCSEFCTCRS